MDKWITGNPDETRGSLDEPAAPVQIMGATGPIIIVPEKKDSIWNKWEEQQSGVSSTSTALPPQPETPTTPAPPPVGRTYLFPIT